MGQSRPLTDRVEVLRSEVERWQRTSHERATEIAALYQRVRELERERTELRDEAQRHSAIALRRAAEIVRLRERLLEYSAARPPAAPAPVKP